MSTITKPMALDESFNTTETNPRSIADVLVGIEGALEQGMGRQANEVAYDNTTSGLSADDVQEAVDELASEKVDKVVGKGLSTNDYTDDEKSKLEGIEEGAQVNPQIDSELSDSSTNAVQNKVVKGALDGKANSADVTEVDTTDTTPFLYRKTSYNADGVFLDELVGASVVKNQLVDQSQAQSGDYNGVIYTKNSDGSWSLTGTPNNNNSFRNIDAVVGLKRYIENHVYYIPKCTTDSKTIGLRVYGISNSSNPSVVLTDSISGDRIIKNNATAAAYESHYVRIQVTNLKDTDIGTVIVKPHIHDLTQMFGTTIADYVYTLEQATAGSGIAWLKSYGFFTKDYYPYNTGELISVKTSGKKYVGKNQFDYTQYANLSTDYDYTSGSYKCKKIKVLPNTVYTVSQRATTASNTLILMNNIPDISDGNYFDCRPAGSSKVYTTDDSGYLYIGAIASNSEINTRLQECRVQIELGSQVTEYVPYTETTYDISNIDLRGIPKLVNNELVYDGDTYDSNGDVTRRFGIVDLGSLNWGKNADNMLARYSDNQDVIGSMMPLPSVVSTVSKSICAPYISSTWSGVQQKVSDKIICAYGGSSGGIIVYDSAYTDATTFKTAMSGVYLIYELATPTTETTDPYTNPQICDKDGTEEFIDDRTVPVPVGHNSRYADLPAIMDGDYLGYMARNFASEEYTDRAVKGEIEQHLEMPYLRILDNDVDTEIKNYQLYYRMIASAYTLVNLVEMLQHRFLFVEVVQNPSGTANDKLLHSALIDPRTIDGFEYQMKAGTGDTVCIETNIAENKLDLFVQSTGTHTSGDPTDYYVTIRMVD